MTDRSVRAWVRRSEQPTAEATLNVDGLPPVHGQVSLSAETDWNGAIELELPKPAPGHGFSCQSGSDLLTGRLAPAPGSPAKLTFAFGSCNRPFEPNEEGKILYNEAAGIYLAMAEELKRADADLVMLAGDQVYSDEIDSISVRDNLSGDEDHPPPFEQVLDGYRHIYRGYLGQPGFRRLRTGWPTYCIWDDHDIFGTWGSRLEGTPLDTVMFRAATKAYVEYQHLRNPAATAQDQPPFHYSFEFGDVGFLVLDVRGARDYPGETILGSGQWSDVQEYLAGPLAARVSTLFVVSSIPVAHTARWFAFIFSRFKGKYGDQVRDRWCANSFVAARDKLLNALCDWQVAAPSRQVIVLSGDIHMANAFTIRRREGGGVIEQFTSSALTTLSDSGHRRINQLVTRGGNLFEPNFSFERHFLAFENNFGLVAVTPRDAGGHRVELDVRGWDPAADTLSSVAKRVTEPALR